MSSCLIPLSVGVSGLDLIIRDSMGNTVGRLEETGGKSSATLKIGAFTVASGYVPSRHQAIQDALALYETKAGQASPYRIASVDPEEFWLVHISDRHYPIVRTVRGGAEDSPVGVLQLNEETNVWTARIVVGSAVYQQSDKDGMAAVKGVLRGYQRFSGVFVIFSPTVRTLDGGSTFRVPADNTEGETKP